MRAGVTASRSATVAVKNRVQAVIKKQSATFIELAHDIHEHPEVAFAGAYARNGLPRSWSRKDSPSALESVIWRPPSPPPQAMGSCMSASARSATHMIKGSIMAAATTSSPSQRSPPPSASNQSQPSLGLTVSVIGTPGEDCLASRIRPLVTSSQARSCCSRREYSMGCMPC